MQRTKRTFKQIEEDFNSIVDQRIKARSNNDYKTLADTEEAWKNLHKEYIQSVHDKYTMQDNEEPAPPLTEEERVFVKKTFRSLGLDNK